MYTTIPQYSVYNKSVQCTVYNVHYTVLYAG